MNFSHQNSSFGSRARRLTRRLSYGISRVLREWNTDSSDGSSFSKIASHDDRNTRIFDIDELVDATKFTKSEIQFIYRDFKLKCPTGILTEKGLIEIYSHLFSCGDCTIYAKHLFSAMAQQVNTINRTRRHQIQNTNNNNNQIANTEINFKDFVIALSSIMRGSLDDRIRWLFNFYDINKDGKITHDEISSMVYSLYDLMGQNVNPPVDDAIKNQHIENVIKKLGLDVKSDKVMTYNEFYQLFSNNQELIETMLNVF